ncbi:hypothetical protein Hanom_Chr13g01230431 [Helianthus anomalus]
MVTILARLLMRVNLGWVLSQTSQMVKQKQINCKGNKSNGSKVTYNMHHISRISLLKNY